MPTITIDKDSFDVWGKHTHVQADFTFDSSYPAGGEALAAGDFMMKTIKGVQVVGQNAAAGRMMFSYDNTNKKLMCFYPTGGASASPGSLADPVPSTPVLAHASGGVTVTSSAATMPDHAATAGTQAPGRGKEVLDTTDLSTLTVRLMVIGLGT